MNLEEVGKKVKGCKNILGKFKGCENIWRKNKGYEKKDKGCENSLGKFKGCENIGRKNKGCEIFCSFPEKTPTGYPDLKMTRPLAVEKTPIYNDRVTRWAINIHYIRR